LGINSLIAMFTRHDVFLIWILMIGYAFMSVSLVKFFNRFNSPINFQRIVHSFYLSSIIALVFYIIWVYDDWPMVPKGSFCAEMVVVLMKVHSYLVNNREFFITRALEKKTDKVNPDEPTLPTLPVPVCVKFPENVTYYNFLLYLLFPTLVYELEYPRTDRIRMDYVFEKVFTAAGIFAFIHVVSDQYIVPIILESPNVTPVEAVSKLVIPIFFGYMLVFYLVFDCICNGFAEITRFADREFYKDWWNSTTMDEFARSWNKPVHEWLLRHIYLESMETYRLSKNSATLVTFLFSSFLHEAFMILCFRMFRPWLFLLQMAQVPLIIFGRDLKGTRLGNLMFWFAILLGIPLISILYSREFYAQYVK